MEFNSEDLHMRSVTAKFIPRLLVHDLQNQLKEESEFFPKVITNDETGCFGYYPKT